MERETRRDREDTRHMQIGEQETEIAELIEEMTQRPRERASQDNSLKHSKRTKKQQNRGKGEIGRHCLVLDQRSKALSDGSLG